MRLLTLVVCARLFVLAGLCAESRIAAGSTEKPPIEGRVVYETDLAPVVGLTIRCFGTPEGSPYNSFTRTVTTDENGRFLIPDAVPGTYSFYIMREPDSAWTHRNVYHRMIARNNNEIVLSLVKGQVLTGKIVDYNGAIVADALIDVRSKTVYFRAKSDSNGLFSLHVPPDDYWIEVLSAPTSYPPDRFFSAALPEYGPNLLVRRDEVLKSKVALFTFYPTVMPDPNWAEPFEEASDPTVIATRHIVEWIASGRRLPGCDVDYVDSRAMRDRERFVVLCTYLPLRPVIIGSDPRIRRVTQPEFDTMYGTRGYDYKKTVFITIRWIEKGMSGELHGFWVEIDFGYLAGQSYKIIFSRDGVTMTAVVENHGGK